MAASAEAAFHPRLDYHRSQGTAREIGQRLTAVSSGGMLTRRTLPRADLLDIGVESVAAEQVIDAFAGRRAAGHRRADSTDLHDVLLSAWPRLRGWLEADLAGRALRGQLLEDAGEVQDQAGGKARLFVSRRTPGREFGRRCLAGRPAPTTTGADQHAQPVHRPPRPGHKSVAPGCAARCRRTLSVLLVAALIAATIAVFAQQDALRAQREAGPQRDAAVADRAVTQSELLPRGRLRHLRPAGCGCMAADQPMNKPVPA